MIGSLPFAPKPRIKWDAEKRLWSCLSGSPGGQSIGAFGMTPADAWLGWQFVAFFGKAVAA